MAQVEIRDLEKCYGSVKSVDGVSLDVADGELVTLLGSSGCGKTTTLRIVAGLISEDSGTVAIGGKAMSGVPPWRRNIGIVFQHYALFPHMTVHDNIAYGLRLRKWKADRIRSQVDRLAQVVEIGGLLPRYPRELSGGQQQRVAVARALAIDPAVLLMDEPLSGLDASLRERVQYELRALQQASGTTTIYVTHDQHEAFALSDRVAVMNSGRIEQVGPVADVYNRPASSFTAGFIGSNNRLSGTVAGVERGGTGVVTHAGARLRFASRGTVRAGQAVDVVVRANRIGLVGEDAPHAYPARVVTCTFSPTAWRVVVDAAGLTLRADISEGEFAACPRPPAPGERVWISVHPDNVWVFPAQGAAPDVPGPRDQDERDTQGKQGTQGKQDRQLEQHEQDEQQVRSNT
jgi:ABC-type Fe3+/spermidine/putrescine transport system ATPase subunit